MTNLAALVLLLIAFAPSISYFRYQRPVQDVRTGQNYFVVDESVWQHARPDLGDLRLFANGKEVPYSLLEQRGNYDPQRRVVPVLQQAEVGGKTQFLVDMSSLDIYDRVELSVTTKNYVAHAWVEGSDDAHAETWAKVGDGIIYDLTSERLGSNTVLRLPASKYKYLRVTLDGPVKPREVQGAVTEAGKSQPAVWRDVARASSVGLKDRDTLIVFDISDKVPIERIVFTIDSPQSNYRREVEVRDEKQDVLGMGEINRIHLVRNGQKIDSENETLSLSTRGHNKLFVLIRNGDDPPLNLSGARLQQMERRVYFDAPGSASLALYYGDEKLQSPIYDYSKLFVESPNPAVASLGEEAANTAYTGRPDDRPWTERHPAVLWTAIVAAVLVLGAIALRSMKTA